MNTGGILLHKCRIMKSEGWALGVFNSTTDSYSFSVNMIFPTWLEGSVRSFSYLQWISHMSSSAVYFLCRFTLLSDQIQKTLRAHLVCFRVLRALMLNYKRTLQINSIQPSQSLCQHLLSSLLFNSYIIIHIILNII